MTPESDEYLVRHRGKVVGPFDLKRLLRKISMGTLNSLDHWSSDDGRTWNGELGDLVGSVSQAGGSGDDMRNGEPHRTGGGKQGQAGGSSDDMRNGEPGQAGGPTSPATSVEWYYTFQKQNLGPVTKQEIQDLVDLGQLTEFDLVWTKGMDEYVPVLKLFGKSDTSSLDAPPLPPIPPEPQPPDPDPPIPNRASTELIVCGYIFAFLLSLVGFVLGIVTYAKGSVGHGIAQIGISIFMTFIYMVVAASVIHFPG